MMSGPKSYHYHVDAAVLRAQREAARLAAEQVRLAAALARFERDYVAGREQLGSAIGEAPDIGLPGATAKSQAEFERRLAGAQAVLDERIRAAQQSQMLAAVASAVGGVGAVPSVVTGEVALAKALARVQSQDAKAHAKFTPQDLAAAVSRNLLRVPAEATRAERERIQADAAELLVHADEPYAEARLDGLRASVMTVERAATERARRTRAVETALGRLSALQASVDPTLIADLERARGGSGPIPPDLEARVGEAEALAMQHQERAYVASVLAETLGDLGYEVGPSFETNLDAAGFADVSVPSWAGYGVRVRSAPAGERLSFNVVRGEGDVDARRDAEVEGEWCSALPEIVDRLGRAGIEAERVAAVAAGAQPVQVDPSRPAIPSQGRSQSGRARELPAEGR